MSDNPSYQPTPVAGPTAVPTYNLPNIPANAYQLLSNFADAIDTANTKLSGHASKLSDINTSTNNAVGEVTSTSKGQATDTLTNVWHGSKSDISAAHNQLTTIAGSSNQSLGWGDFRTVLNENKAAIQTGLSALENLQDQQSGRAAPASASQLQQWEQDIQTLDGAIANVNMAVEIMTMAICSLNNSFAAACATGFVPGGPLPVFTKNAFANQMSNKGPGSGDRAADENRLRNALTNAGITGSEADILILDAQGAGLNFNVISNLLENGVSSDTIQKLLPEIENVVTDTSQHNLDDLNTGKITQRKYATKMQNMDEIVNSICSKPEYIQSMENNNITFAEMYNVIDDSNVDFRMTPNNAITALTGPEGTASSSVAGPSGTLGDVKFYDDKGNLIFTRENKALTTTSRSGFNGALRLAANEMKLQDGQHAEIFLQTQPGMNPTDIESWVKRYMGTRVQAGDAAKYSNVTIMVVDPSGNVIYTNKMMP